ncbi:MAG: Trk system potassium transporter TrkA [Rickettsiales bacterium]|nr:Trk system potassium transporter TrkA [Pseudomonadota bacterium]MDA0965557.1 Trk system potassium transporter TrkA [Pseudomonadota bacterium]MDG4542881.1 Trk system potassium transporter TrkA [Rickettsiales bacterium]MDG4544671.1 Trk system potassium transporter TrkA [Rickettsiales bacterium]MDG4546793.1 Trk system potassium transporter TrkA [Rickettsiales bacterium]
MRIIVCGAGQVGSSIARQLSIEGNDVTVIDQSAEHIQMINDTLDVKAKIGFASHPTVLEEVGAENTDMIIAVTLSDEINMVACQVAHSLFNIPTKIARIRNQNYLRPEWMRLYRHDHLPIDFIISPEIEVANAIVNRLHVPGAVDTIPFVDGLVKVVGIRCTVDCPMINMPVERIQKRVSEFDVSILGILRGESFLVTGEGLELLDEDELYFSCDTKNVQKVMAMFGHEEREARRVTIIGGGNVGLFLAEQLEKEDSDVKVKLIEVDKDRAEQVADRLNRTTVINGSALSQEILEEANVALAETVIAVSNDDEVNILSSLLSKRFGAHRVVTLVNNASSYSPLTSSLGIDVAINPREITVSSILQHIRKGRIVAVHSICKGKAEVIEAEAVEASSVVGKRIKDLALPNGIVIGTMVRNGETIVPDEDTIIKVGDRIVILSLANMVSKVEKIFSVKFEFF